eukprot:TRINITY_DN5506_c0_g1_i1.p1 TRINITY_DN5506_c0_g1~~TRINITY_DN5506_c0_g1_i1.p1  ORF type:complete len:1943 (+),score=461.24 TRINITY_DN5506_c0_g1_i1:69-5897(+)
MAPASGGMGRAAAYATPTPSAYGGAAPGAVQPLQGRDTSVSENLVRRLRAAHGPGDRHLALCAITREAGQAAPREWVAAGLCEALCGLLIGPGRPVPERVCRAAAQAVLAALHGEKPLRSFFQLTMGLLRSSAPAVCSLLYCVTLLCTADSTAASAFAACRPAAVLLELYDAHCTTPSPAGQPSPAASLNWQSSSPVGPELAAKWSATPPDGGASPQPKRPGPPLRWLDDSSPAGSPRRFTVGNAGGAVEIPRLRLAGREQLEADTPTDRIMRLVEGRRAGRPALSNCRLSTNDVVKDFAVAGAGVGQYQRTLLHLAHKVGRLYATKDLPPLLAQRRSLGAGASRRASPIIASPPQPPHGPPEAAVLAAATAAARPSSTSLAGDPAAELWYAECCMPGAGNACVGSLRLLCAGLLARVTRGLPSEATACVPTAWRELHALHLDTCGAHDQLAEFWEQVLHEAARGAEAASLPPQRGDDAVLWGWADIAAGLLPNGSSIGRAQHTDALWPAAANHLRVLADYLRPAAGTHRLLAQRAAEICCKPLVALLAACRSRDALCPTSVAVAAQLLRVFTPLLSSRARSPALDAFLWQLLVVDDPTRQWLRAFSRVALAPPRSPLPPMWLEAIAQADETAGGVGTTVPVAVAGFWAALFKWLAHRAREGVPQMRESPGGAKWATESASKRVSRLVSSCDFLFSPVDGAVLTWLAHEPVFDNSELKAALLRLTAALGTLPRSPLLQPSVAASYLRLHYLALLQAYQSPQLADDAGHVELARLHTECIVRLVQHDGGYLRSRAAQLGMFDLLIEEIGVDATAEERRDRLMADHQQLQEQQRQQLACTPTAEPAEHPLLADKLSSRPENESLPRRSVTWLKKQSKLCVDEPMPSPAQTDAGPQALPSLARVPSARSGPGDETLALSTVLLDDAPGPGPRLSRGCMSDSWVSPRDQALGSSGRGGAAPPDPAEAQSAQAGAGSARRPPKVPTLRLGQATPQQRPLKDESPASGPQGGVVSSPITLPACSGRTPTTPIQTPEAVRHRPKIPSLRLGGAAPANWGTSEPGTPGLNLPSVARSPPSNRTAGTAELPRMLGPVLTSPEQRPALHTLPSAVSQRTAGSSVGSAQQHLVPRSLAFPDPAEQDSALYRHRELHSWLILLAVVLYIDPSSLGTVDPLRAADPGHAFRCFYSHFNHMGNPGLAAEVLDHATACCGAAVATKVAALVKLAAVSLFPAALYSQRGKLGGGAYGSVWRCDVGGGCGAVAAKQVAVRVDNVADVFAELLAMRACGDGFLAAPPLLDWGCDGASFFLVTPTFSASLKDWRSKQLPRDAAARHLPALLRVFHSTLDCLAAAHRRGVVHCDLKCDNVLLFWLPGGRVPLATLCDWGESVFRVESERASLRARGSEHVRPPEVLLAHRTSHDYDRRRQAAKAAPDLAVDVWAIGCLLFELLTGELLFHDDLFPRFFRRVTEATEPVLVDRDLQRLPPVKGVRDLLLLALSRDPKRRPSVGDLKKQCLALLDTLPAGDYPDPPAPRAPAVPDPAPALPEPAELQRVLFPALAASELGDGGPLAPLCRGLCLGQTTTAAECAERGVALVVCATLERPDLRHSRAAVLHLGANLHGLLPRAARAGPLGGPHLSRRMSSPKARHSHCRAAAVQWAAALDRAAGTIAEGGSVAAVGSGDGALLFGGAFLAVFHGLTVHEAACGALLAEARRTRAAVPSALPPQLAGRLRILLQCLQQGPCGALPAPHRIDAWQPAQGAALRARSDGAQLLRCPCGLCIWGARSPAPPAAAPEGWWAACAARMARLWGAPAAAAVLRVAPGDFVADALAGLSVPAPPTGGVLCPPPPPGWAAHCCARCHYVTHLESPDAVCAHASVADGALALAPQLGGALGPDRALSPGVSHSSSQVLVADSGQRSDIVTVDLRVQLFRRCIWTPDASAGASDDL